MANRRGQNVTTRDGFDPKPLLPDGNIAIVRPDGSDATRLAGAYGSLADEFGKQADRAARIEGKRAGDVAGNDPSFRPTGSTTLRGAAFDEAATASYLNNLDAKVRSRMTDLFQEHENNPTALKGALDGLKAELVGNDVFPEVAASFNASFERLRLPFQTRALDNLQTRQRDELRASAVVASNASDTYRERAILAAPDKPETLQAIEDSLASDDARDQAAVRAEAMTATEAAQRKIGRRRDATARLYVAQGGALSDPVEVRALRESVTQRFKEGKTALDVAGYAHVQQRLLKQEDQLVTSARTRLNEAESTLNAIAKQYAEGLETSPAELEVARQAAQTGGEEGQRLLRRFDARRLVASVARSKSPAELEQVADQLAEQARTSGQGLTVEQGQTIEDYRTTARIKRAAQTKDRVSYDRRMGDNTSKPLFVPAKDAAPVLAAQVRQSVAAAKATANGGEPTFFSKDDQGTLESAFAAGGDRAIDVVRGVVDGAGADAPAVLRELGIPELGGVGDLLVNGGPDAEKTAREAMRGLALRRSSKEAAAGSGGSRSGSAIPQLPAGTADIMRGHFGPAYLNSTNAQIAVTETAKAIYQARAAEKGGIDPKSPEAKTLFQESLDAAAGRSRVGGADYGGVADYKPPGWWFGGHKTVVPTNVRTGRFREVVGAVKDEDLAALPNGPPKDDQGNVIGARELRNAIPVKMRGGYGFALGDPAKDDTRFIGPKGKPYVLDLNALEPKLRGRVPDAFLGGDR